MCEVRIRLWIWTERISHVLSVGFNVRWSVAELSSWLESAMALPVVASGVTREEVDGGAALELVPEGWLLLGALSKQTRSSRLSRSWAELRVHRHQAFV